MNSGITRSMLMDSLVFGKPIKLWFCDPTQKVWHVMLVRVTGLSLESGSAEGVAAQSYNVQCGPWSTYVRTID